MNPDIATAKPHVLAALRKGQAVISIGDLHGWPRPQLYTDAVEMLYAAREVERAVPTMPPAPNKPGSVKKWVDTAAEHRLREAARRDVIDELVIMWERETASAGLAATADYAARLAAVFDELVEKFDAHADAPRELSGHETEEEVARHTSALRAASELSTVLLQRAQIADAAQEAEDIGPDPVWLVLAPTPAATRDQVNDALATFRERFPQSLAEWDELRPIGMRLAARSVKSAPGANATPTSCGASPTKHPTWGSVTTHTARSKAARPVRRTA